MFLDSPLRLLQIALSICKSWNGELGNGMSGMMGTREIRVGTWGIKVGMQGIRVGMREIRVILCENLRVNCFD